MAGAMADTLVLAALAAGEEVAVAAATAKLSERTVYRRLADPAFRAELAALRRGMLDRAVGRLTDATTAAVETLVRNLTAETASVQVRAAVAVLEQVTRLRQHAELEYRLAELEAAFGEQGGSHALR